MDNTDSRPSLALDQLQLPLDGVRPLSNEEQLERWLAQQTEETVYVYNAVLYLCDGNTRSARAQRWADVRAVQEPYDAPYWLVSGGNEVLWLYYESERTFVEGLFLASLLCAHAACERVLAGCLEPCREQLDKNWLRWGLGRLTQAAFEHDLIDTGLRDDLFRVSEARRVSAHYKPPLTPDTVILRALDRAEGSAARSTDELVDEVLHDDALFSFKVATILIKGDYSSLSAHLH